MSGFVFRPAKRSNQPLIVGIAGSSGSGKTFSALRLATGLAAGKPIAMIDTENGRGLHYADQFQFLHAGLLGPFRPQRYLDAISAAEALDPRPAVIVVDSFSHVWDGPGGCLDWHEEVLDEMVERSKSPAPDWQKRDANNMRAWATVKRENKLLVQKLLFTRAHLILCLRAEQKVTIARDERGRHTVEPKQGVAGFKGWIPICEKRLPYELTASFLMVAEQPGVPLPIKLEEQHRSFIPTDRPMDEEAGARLGRWAAGDEFQPPPPAMADTAACLWASTAIDAAETVAEIAETLKRAKAEGARPDEMTKLQAQATKRKGELIR